MTATRLPTCDVDEAPHLPGTIRVTAIYEDGEGDTIYFDPATLPEHMQKMDRIKDVSGRTYRTRAQTVKGRAKMRDYACALLATNQETALNILLWLYFRHPDTKFRVADSIQKTLDAEGLACLTIVRNRRTGVTTAWVTSRFTPGLVALTEITMPPGQTCAVVMGDDPPSGTA